MRFAALLAASAALWVQPAAAAAGNLEIVSGALLNPVLEELIVRGATPGAEIATPRGNWTDWFSFGITDANGDLDYLGDYSFRSGRYGFYALYIYSFEAGHVGEWDSHWHIGTVTDFVTGDRPPPVPEPSTWAMMILGFGLIGGALRRRQLSVKFPPPPELTPVASAAP